MEIGAGQVLADGKYRLTRLLGEGGMAWVWAADLVGPEGFEKDVVVKIIRPEASDKPTRRQMLIDEARLAARLHHPNVVEIYELAAEEGLDYIVMERIRGHDLDVVLQRSLDLDRGAIPWSIAVRIIAEVANGLHYAHTRKTRSGRPLRLVHRDLKLSNVLLTREGGGKIIDFGIAKASTNLARTKTGWVKGTIAFMSPEQIKGENLDGRSDLFSLGVILYALCSAKLPFAGDSTPTVMYKILDSSPPPLKVFAPDAPEELWNIIRSLLRKDAAERTPSARILEEQLDGVLRSTGEYAGRRELARYYRTLFPEDMLDSGLNTFTEEVMTPSARPREEIEEAEEEHAVLPRTPEQGAIARLEELTSTPSKEPAMAGSPARGFTATEVEEAETLAVEGLGSSEPGTAPGTPTPPATTAETSPGGATDGPAAPPLPSELATGTEAGDTLEERAGPIETQRVPVRSRSRLPGIIAALFTVGLISGGIGWLFHTGVIRVGRPTATGPGGASRGGAAAARGRSGGGVPDGKGGGATPVSAAAGGSGDAGPKTVASAPGTTDSGVPSSGPKVQTKDGRPPKGATAAADDPDDDDGDGDGNDMGSAPGAARAGRRGGRRGSRARAPGRRSGRRRRRRTRVATEGRARVVEAPSTASKAGQPAVAKKPPVPVRPKKTGTGTLVVTIKPRCVLFHGDDKLGTAERLTVKKPAGKYVLRCVNRKARFWRLFRVEIEAGQTARLTRNFRRGGLQVLSNPSWCSVMLRNFGPIGYSSQVLKLYEGTYAVVLAREGKPDRGRVRKRVTIVPGKVKVVKQSW